MKRLILPLILLLSFSVNAQSIEEKLKAQVLKSEADEAKKNGRLLTDMQFASFQYKLIPIKDWWKMFYDIHSGFRTDISQLMKASIAEQQKKDSLNGTHQADSLVAFLAKQAQTQDTTMSKEEAHFKARYENADPAQKVYEVFYELKYNEAGREVKNRKLRKAFYQNDLSNVRSFK